MNDQPSLKTDPRYSPTFREAVEKLERYGMARDRVTDREVRTFTLTDDEAISLLDVLYGYAP